MREIIFSLINSKRVLFITTKNLDYIRNTQEINLLKSKSKFLKIIGFTQNSYLSRLLLVYKELIITRVEAYDVIFIGFLPQLVLPFWKHRFKRKTVIIDFFISLYDTLVFDRQTIKAKGVISRFLHFLDKLTLSNADVVISDTNAHAEYFSDEFLIPRQKFHVFYLEADTEIYFPRPQVKKSVFEKKFIVFYFGSILPLQGIEVIFKAAETLKDHEDIIFDIVGPVHNKTKRSSGSLKNVFLTPWLTQEELANRIAAADLCLAGHFNKQIDKASRTIPGKAYIYQAMKKPMILGDNPANHEIFIEDKTHFFVCMGDAKALSDQILKVKVHWDG